MLILRRFNCEFTERNRFFKKEHEVINRAPPRHRRQTWKDLRKVMNSYIRALHGSLQREHVPLISGYSKFGKTFVNMRLLDKVVSRMRKRHRNVHFEYIYTTFNSRTPYQRVEFQEYTTSVAWRAFFMDFVSEACTETSNWTAFLQFLAKHASLAEKFTLDNLHVFVVQDLKRRTDCTNIDQFIVVLGVDEFQWLNSVEEFDEANTKSPVQRFVRGLLSVANPVFPVLSG